MAKISLHAAAKNGNVKAARKLIEEGCDLEAADSSGDTPLMVAVIEKHYEVVKLLLESNANVKAKNQCGETVMHYATHRGTIEMLDLLYEHGANVNAKGEDGVAPLACAVGGSEPEIARWLLEHGAKVNSRDKEGSTAFHLARAMMPAFKRGASPFVPLLEEFGADPTIVDKRGMSPADFPVQPGNRKKK